MRNTEHDISFRKDGNSVEVNVQTNLPQHYTDNTERQDKTLHFICECNSDVEAELLVRYLRDRHRKAIEAVRLREFFSGWKHAIAKKHGKKWFSWFGGTLKNEASND